VLVAVHEWGHRRLALAQRREPVPLLLTLTAIALVNDIAVRLPG